MKDVLQILSNILIEMNSSQRSDRMTELYQDLLIAVMKVNTDDVDEWTEILSKLSRQMSEA